MAAYARHQLKDTFTQNAAEDTLPSAVRYSMDRLSSLMQDLQPKYSHSFQDLHSDDLVLKPVFGSPGVLQELSNGNCSIGSSASEEFRSAISFEDRIVPLQRYIKHESQPAVSSERQASPSSCVSEVPGVETSRTALRKRRRNSVEKDGQQEVLESIKRSKGSDCKDDPARKSEPSYAEPAKSFSSPGGKQGCATPANQRSAPTSAQKSHVATIKVPKLSISTLQQESSKELDYVHVRARRGEATDKHSLAERVRREKIRERMKFLESLVPSCIKATGKAMVLDEIINYVQSLQCQVEFLSMKLAAIAHEELEFSADCFLGKQPAKQWSHLHSPSMSRTDPDEPARAPLADYSTSSNAGFINPIVGNGIHQSNRSIHDVTTGLTRQPRSQELNAVASGPCADLPFFSNLPFEMGRKDSSSHCSIAESKANPLPHLPPHSCISQRSLSTEMEWEDEIQNVMHHMSFIPEAKSPWFCC
ncbi:hypothetical protein KP509_22G021400 [Ceratopteris richardii]|uniref:BHLH domain-containing protein n=1 Tax=Ceratopteris richardii TaxID=49495 RepID=A0A8T2S5U8_CERRI|nr:hypothetical protein KP509_22G021400 [Ceratopteris richardii]